MKSTTDQEKKHSLQTVCIFPAIMVVSYLVLLGYFKSKGGYAAVHLATDDPVAAEM